MPAPQSRWGAEAEEEANRALEMMAGLGSPVVPEV